jgi:hypothetical protein
MFRGDGILDQETVMTNKALSLILTALVFGSMGDIALARSHTQNISKSIATAFCDKHGGGTECGFCDPKHCHVISCANEGGKCTNDVIDKIRAKSGDGHTNITTVKGGDGDNNPPKRHPINVDAPNKPILVKSPVDSPTPGRGGMNQGSHRH